MKEILSRSEVKRQYKQIEQLAQELVALSKKDIRALPCDDELRGEIIQAHSLKGGAWKRQVKYLAKMLRQEGPVAELLVFLEQRKGSHLKETREFQQLEQLRDAVLTAAIVEAEEAEENQEPVPAEKQAGWEALRAAVQSLPELDLAAATMSARDYARTRNPRYRRELFRQLKGAMERGRLARAGER